MERFTRYSILDVYQGSECASPYFLVLVFYFPMLLFPMLLMLKVKVQFNPFQPSVACHAETSHLFLRSKINDCFPYEMQDWTEKGYRQNSTFFKLVFLKIIQFFRQFFSQSAKPIGKIPVKLKFHIGNFIITIIVKIFLQRIT